MIILSGQTPIGAGGEKIVYRHPQNPRLVVKVIKDGVYETAKRRKPVRFFLRGKSYYNPVHREHRSYLRAVSKKQQIVLRHIPKCHGIAQTDKGESVVSDMICGADGSPALNLRQYVETAGAVNAPLRTAIKEFLRCIRNPSWADYDTFISNILVAEKQDGEIRLVHCEYVCRWPDLMKFGLYHRHRIERKLKCDFAPLLQKYGAEF